MLPKTEKSNIENSRRYMLVKNGFKNKKCLKNPYFLNLYRSPITNVHLGFGSLFVSGLNHYCSHCYNYGLFSLGASNKWDIWSRFFKAKF